MARDPLVQPLGPCGRCGGTLFLLEDQWGRLEKCVSCGRTFFHAPDEMPRVAPPHLAKVLPMRATTFRRLAA